MLNRNNLSFLVCSLFLLAITSCSPYAYLVDVETRAGEGPIAADCGSCHVSQFQEWSVSRHAFAYQNGQFQKEYNDAGDEDCLACHAPVSVREGEPIPRAYNTADGVDCISCHYSEGKMHGPHAASALFQPHPVEAKDTFYLGVAICGRCHGETHDEYAGTAQNNSLPTCLECHAAAKERTASQGTNLFSDALVSFEDKVTTHSHTISLDAQVPEEFIIQLAVEHPVDDREQITVEVINRLPHNLPTGTFGQKRIRLSLQYFRSGIDIGHAELPVADGLRSLASGAVKRLRFSLPKELQKGDVLHICLERLGAPDDPRPVVVLAKITYTLTAL